MAKKETQSKLAHNKEFIIKTGIQSLGVFVHQTTLQKDSCHE